MPMQSTSRVPYELMLEIIALLSKDRGTLFKLLFLHPSYKAHIEQILYRNMTDWIHLPSHQGFLNTVRNNTRLASYVHRYAFIEDEDNLGPLKRFGDESIRSYWENVVLAVDNMSNLKEFMIYLSFIDDELFPASGLLSALQPKNIEVFKWDTVRWTDHMAPFIASQPSLINLWIKIPPTYLDAFRDAIKRDKPSLPNLRKISSSWGVCQTLVEGNRSVRSLVCYARLGPLGDGSTHFLKSMNNITSLVLTTCTPNNTIPIILRGVALTCPHLICLEFPVDRVRVSPSHHPNPLGFVNLEDHVQPVAHGQLIFPRLEYLIMSTVSVYEAEGTTVKSIASAYFSSHVWLKGIYSGARLNLHRSIAFLPKHDSGSYRPKNALDNKSTYRCWKRGATALPGLGVESSDLHMEGLVFVDHSIFDDLPQMLMARRRTQEDT
ncbi:hypothetical protein CVT24_008506 [Panaeolus cyanescens]|uniref:F-box domain-containing protein n=1 Tax=Panaeolus cyanescens TaxID=181874 RepID=A0A409W4J0_9AGAR|nr:hypothetical protein CVT24_008506 [Panaeolus cyanescens]